MATGEYEGRKGRNGYQELVRIEFPSTVWRLATPRRRNPAPQLQVQRQQKTRVYLFPLRSRRSASRRRAPLNDGRPRVVSLVTGIFINVVFVSGRPRVFAGPRLVQVWDRRWERYSSVLGPVRVKRSITVRFSLDP